MKNNKWLFYTLGTLLILVILAAVAVVSYRIGATQNISFARPAFTRGFNGGPLVMQGPPHGNGWTKTWGNSQERGFDSHGYNHGNNRREGGMRFFSPIFGLIHLVIFGLVIALLGWFGYTLVKKSGWRLTRVQETSSVPPPSASETPSAAVDKKKKLK